MPENQKYRTYRINAGGLEFEVSIDRTGVLGDVNLNGLAIPVPSLKAIKVPDFFSGRDVTLEVALTSQALYNWDCDEHAEALQAAQR